MDFRLLAVAMLVGSTSMCNRKDIDQEYHERIFVSKIVQVLNIEQARTLQPVWITNFLQVVSLMQTQGLADTEAKFLTLYGKKAGFTNSLMEKYYFLPSGLKAPRPEDGDMMLVSSHTVQRSGGRWERVLVFKYDGRFVDGWISEDRFEEALVRAGMKRTDLSHSGPLPSMRYLADPTGEQAAAQRSLEEEHHKDVAEFERLHTPPFWQRTYWQIGGLVTLVILILGAFSYYERSRRH